MCPSGVEKPVFLKHEMSYLFAELDGVGEEPLKFSVFTAI